MASLTSFRSLLYARAPLLASVRTHLGYIPFEGRTATPPNDIVKFTLELKKANMQAVTKVEPTNYENIKKGYIMPSRPLTPLTR